MARLAMSAGIALLLCAGCTRWLEPTRAVRSPLSPVEIATDTATLDVIFSRVATTDEEAAIKVWADIDETLISPALRHELAQQGFRVGIVGGQTPATLAKLLDATPKPVSGTEVADQLESNQPIRKQTMQIHTGRRQEIIASGVYEQWPILTREDGAIHGRTLSQAQGCLVLKAYAQGDGRVRLEIKPEIQHGQIRTQVVGDDGMFRMDSSKPKLAFEKLSLDVTLSAGQTLVFAELPNHPGSLGHYFFSEPQNGRAQQKLVAIRFTKTQCDNLFNDASGK